MEAAMLRSVKQLTGFYLISGDEDLGTMEGLYFDDARWTVRHLVVDTGGLLSGRLVLVPPQAVRRINWDDRTIHVNLTKEQLANSPGSEEDKPVSRQRERELFDYYGFPYYWGSPFAWGAAGMPGAAGLVTPPGLPVEPVNANAGMDAESRYAEDREGQGDPHLRSSKEVIGYAIYARDGDLGHVDDFLFDERDWSLQMIEIATRNWLPGKHVVVPVQRIGEVSWDGQRVEIGMTREEISNSMEAGAANVANMPNSGHAGHHPPPPRH
jgi:hypothetical protein